MKTDLRIRAKAIRRDLPICEISENLVKSVRKHSAYIKAKNVLLFCPTKYEVDLCQLLEDDKRFYFPRVKDKDLLICPYSKGDKLEMSCFNILEPCSKAVDVDILDLIIVPALLVDKEGY
ncbi:MAG: 5-formyltetrahydrofolate cyclo-ligase, partial [Candidatus Gastranaerophilales bacterium]|nr:5-formyltetrahydrofolate cyclo-ligase [Candidatus Gastranaerophilales bacterium]